MSSTLPCGSLNSAVTGAPNDVTVADTVTFLVLSGLQLADTLGFHATAGHVVPPGQLGTETVCSRSGRHEAGTGGWI